MRAVLLGLALMPLLASSAVAVPAMFLVGEHDADSSASCGGTAPLTNGCTLEFDAPTGQVTLGFERGAVFVGSMRMHLTDTHGASVVYECDFLEPTPFVRCALLELRGSPIGHLTLTVHVGALDPAAIVPAAPSLNGVETGIGDWNVTVFGS